MFLSCLYLISIIQRDRRVMAQVLPKASVLADNSSDSSDDGITRFEVKIHSLTAKVFLNCELEDLVPEEYAVMAERSRKSGQL